MDFHRYTTHYELATRNPTTMRDLKQLEKESNENRLDIFYRRCINMQYKVIQRAVARMDKGDVSDQARMLQLLVKEHDWHTDHQPYYNIWPGIIRYLTTLNLGKVPPSTIQLPMNLNCLSLRFPVKDNAFTVEFIDGYYKGRIVPVQALMVWIVDSKKVKAPFTDMEIERQDDIKSLFVTAQMNPDNTPEGSVTITSSYPIIPFKDLKGESLEECFQWCLSKVAGDLSKESDAKILRLAASVLLLTTDYEESVILPDVLKDDEQRWLDHKELRQQLMEKAHRRGKVGWNVGQHLEVSPHWRGPCPLALYYYGPRPGVPRYRYRRGCMVHRQAVTQIPTGREEETT